MPALRLSGVRRNFGDTMAVDAVDLSVAQGEVLCLLGPSGCGKTTLLRLIGGYLTPDAGTVAVGGVDVTALPLESRDIGMVFQSFALFPHMSARENVAFGLMARGVARSERERRTEAMLERVGLGLALRNRRPRALSGGEQQRVALARALVIEPKLLLLDEPMASLDRRLRESMRQELKALHGRTHVSTILVTHDQEDALFLADRIAIMASGRLLQVGTPDALYLHPVSAQVARLLGDANILEVEAVAAGRARLAGGLSMPLSGFDAIALGDDVLIRPEHLVVALGSGTMGRSEPRETARATVTSIAYLGADCVAELRAGDGTVLRTRVRADLLRRMRVGDVVGLQVESGRGSQLSVRGAAKGAALQGSPMSALPRRQLMDNDKTAADMRTVSDA